MPIESSAAYIPLDGSRGSCWGQRTSLERGLIFIIAFLTVVAITLTIAVAYKKCEDKPVTTVAPSSTVSTTSAPANTTVITTSTTPTTTTTSKSTSITTVSSTTSTTKSTTPNTKLPVNSTMPASSSNVRPSNKAQLNETVAEIPPKPHPTESTVEPGVNKKTKPSSAVTTSTTATPK